MTTTAPRLLAGTAALSLLLAGVIAATTVSSPALAAAKERAHTITVTDSVDDVREIDVRHNSGPGTVVPDRSNGDIQSEVITYGPDEITIVTVFRELRRPSQRAPKLIYGQMLEYGNVLATAYVFANTRNVRGRSTLDDVHACESHRVDYRLNRIVLRVPSDCLGSPEWIRFGGFAAIRRTTHEGRFIQGDVAPGTGLRRIRWTPRVYRP